MRWGALGFSLQYSCSFRGYSADTMGRWWCERLVPPRCVFPEGSAWVWGVDRSSVRPTSRAVRRGVIR